MPKPPIAGYLITDSHCNHEEIRADEREQCIRLIKRYVECLDEMKDWIQCGKCVFRIPRPDKGYYDCGIEKSLRSAAPEGKKEEAQQEEKK